MLLTETQCSQLTTVLLDGFTEAELAALAATALGQSLTEMAAGAGPAQQASSVVGWAQQHGQVAALVAEAWRRRPQSRVLQALAAELGAPPPTSALTIGQIYAVNVAGVQIIDQRGAAFAVGAQTAIQTGGGAAVGGDVTVEEGDFVGRDQTAATPSVQPPA